MSEPYDHAPGLALVEGLAGAVRRELGDDVEVCPGHQSPDQAEPLNRAFRALVRHVLEHLVGPGYDLPAGGTRVLPQPRRTPHSFSRPIPHRHHRETLMTLAERLRELVRAAFSGIYVQSF